MRYCLSPFFYSRRKTREVVVGDSRNGGVIIGGSHPVVMQSMITCDTMDTAECVKQTLDLVAVGCQIVRITAPTVKDAANLQNIVAELRKRGCNVPIVVDIHFKPEAGMEAAKWVEMVRVNPGNYADSKKFAVKEYTDEQYAAELKRIEEKFTPLEAVLTGPRIIGPVNVAPESEAPPRFDSAPEAVVAPVPPLAIATVPVTFVAVAALPVVFWFSVGKAPVG